MRYGILDKIKARFLGDQAALMGEFDTIKVRARWEQWIINNILENQDIVLQKFSKGKGLDFYDEMLRLDPLIGSHWATRKRAVLSKPWDIDPNGADDNIVQFCKDCIRNITNWRQDVGEMLDAIVKGYSVGEIMWESRSGRWMPREIRSRNPKDYVFGINNELRLLTKAQPVEGEEVPVNKFIRFTHDQQHEDPYGRSILQACYWPYYFKTNNWKFWALAVQRLGMPIIVATVRGNLKPDDKNNLDKFLASLQTQSWFRRPEGVELDTLEPKRSASADWYSPFMEYSDRMSTYVILGQILSTQVTDVGARSLGEVHNQVRGEITETDAGELDAVISEQLFKACIQLNFAGYTGPIPLYKTKASSGENLTERVKVDQTLQQMGYEIPIDYITKTYGVPRPEAGQEVLVKPVSQATPFQPFSERGNRNSLEEIAIREGGNLFSQWARTIKKKSGPLR